MDMITLLLSVLSSALGLYLIAKALIARSSGYVTTGEIVGFQKKRNKGKRLPIILYQDESGIEVTARVQDIDSMTYWIKPLELNEVISFMAQRKNPDQCTIHGYMSIVVGLFLQWPVLFYLFKNFTSAITQGRLGFIFVFFCILAFFWLFLRFVRYNY